MWIETTRKCHCYVFTTWMPFIYCWVGIEFKSDKLDYLFSDTLVKGFNLFKQTVGPATLKPANHLDRTTPGSALSARRVAAASTTPRVPRLLSACRVAAVSTSPNVCSASCSVALQYTATLCWCAWVSVSLERRREIKINYKNVCSPGSPFCVQVCGSVWLWLTPTHP